MLPDFIEENIDYSTDPLVILLMREGEYDEAYQMARQQTAPARQILVNHEIQTCEVKQYSRYEIDAAGKDEVLIPTQFTDKIPISQLLKKR